MYARHPQQKLRSDPPPPQTEYMMTDVYSPTEPKTTLYRAGLVVKSGLPKCTWILRHIGARCTAHTCRYIRLKLISTASVCIGSQSHPPPPPPPRVVMYDIAPADDFWYTHGWGISKIVSPCYFHSPGNHPIQKVLIATETSIYTWSTTISKGKYRWHWQLHWCCSFLLLMSRPPWSRGTVSPPFFRKRQLRTHRFYTIYRNSDNPE